MARLYLISPEVIGNIDEFALQLEEICQLEERPAFFQLRLKGQNINIENAIEKLLPICEKHGVKFVINDDINLALKYKVALHVGSDDASFEECVAFKKAGGVHLGVSCYNSIVRAREFEKIADCISFGAMFASETKPNARTCDFDVVTNYATQSPSKEIAIIGGIDCENIKKLAEILPCVSYVCVISSVWG